MATQYRGPSTPRGERTGRGLRLTNRGRRRSARIGEDDPTRLLALREVAAEAWRDGPAGAPAAEAVAVSAVEPEILSAGAESPRLPGGVPGGTLRIALVAGAVALVLAVSSAVLVAVRLTDTGGDNGRAEATAPLAATAASAPAPPSKPPYACRLERIDGLWYAGNSRTQATTVAYGSAGPEVAEVQCLLRRAGFSPGGIDGMFGPLTQGAAKSFQKHAGLDVDGIVGPHTWKALRG
jgi:hypothetical protein